MDETNDRLSLSTEVRDGEVRASSVDELMQENPAGELTNLTVYFWPRDKNLILTFPKRGNNRLSVEGVDQGWVLSRFDQIQAFCISKRQRFRPSLRRGLYA